jgi:hypothetical protein
MKRFWSLLINRNSSKKMRINPRKIRKILGRFWTAPKCLFGTFCTQEPLDTSAWMQHSQLCFNSENQTKDFSYTIFPAKKINVGKILKLWENFYLIILSIHILKLKNFRVWHYHSNHDHIILGSPFLKLVDAMLDAGEGKVTMNLNRTKYTYNFLRASKHLTPFPPEDE